MEKTLEYKAGSPELKELYQDRKKAVVRTAGFIEPILLKKMQDAEDKDRERVTISMDNLYSILNVLAFVNMLETYEKDAEIPAEEEQHPDGCICSDCEMDRQ